MELKMILFVVFLTAVPRLGVCNCPVYGCTLFHSFTTPTQFFNTSFRPQLLWKFEHDHMRPTGAGCVTNGGRVLCPMDVYEQERSVLFSWEALTNGRVSWNVTLDRSSLPLPVVDISGDVLLSNGYKLLGFTADGKSYGKPIALYPVHGQIMDLSISSNQFLILLYKCGFFVVYLTDGIPHASIWLNDTIKGVKGTFIPLNNPAINSSSSERLYLLTAFKPHKPSQNHSFSQDLHMRVYAIDVTANMAYRIQTIWTYDFILPSASVPYMASNETMCKLQYPPGNMASDGVHTAENAKQKTTKLPADVIVRRNVTFITFNYNDTETGESRCRLVSITNLGKSYSINFSKDTVHQCSGIAFNSHESTTLDELVTRPLMVWLHIFEYDTQGSSLLLMDVSTGSVTVNVSLASLIGKDSDIKISSQMLIACLYLGNGTVGLPSYELSGRTPVPLIFGVTDSAGKASVIAIDLSDTENLKVIWRLPLLAGQHVTGQISTVDRLKDSLMIFTDQSGVYFYKIS